MQKDILYAWIFTVKYCPLLPLPTITYVHNLVTTSLISKLNEDTVLIFVISFVL